MQIKVNAGRFKVPMNLESIDDNRLKVSFRFNRILISEIKSMEGARWNPENKYWTIKDCTRNWFALTYLQGIDVFTRYDKSLDIDSLDFERTLYPHQKEMVVHGLVRKQCIIGAQMGTGKTLAGIEIMERSGFNQDEWLWIGPKSALAGVYLEFDKWKSRIRPEMYTYDGLKRLIANWSDGKPAYRGVIFDESSRLKNKDSQRSQVAFHLAENMRKEHKNEAIIIAMSGTPAPKNPCDWWHQAEVTRPGFLKEGHPTKLKKSLALIEDRQTLAGAAFPHLVTWWDDDKKCKICGEYEEDHKSGFFELEEHDFAPSVNEVRRLYRRLKGLVLVQLKKDCLKDLPDKIYKKIDIEPKPATMRAAKIVATNAKNTISALTLLRELSDGFQYSKDEDGKRIVKQVATPKEEILKDILEDHNDGGRIVIFAGFSASVDRVVGICRANGWSVIQVDGRGWRGFGDIPSTCAPHDLLARFQDPSDNKIAFVGQSGAGGMGITLTRSPTIVYWSNDFNAESRSQSEDRIHRIGMDKNKGATIIDLLHLPTDELVLNNLQKKKNLQDMSLGVVQKSIETGERTR